MKQKLGIESYNYNPTVKLIRRMIQGSQSFESGKDGLKDKLYKMNNKVTSIKTKRQLNEYIENIEGKT